MFRLVWEVAFVDLLIAPQRPVSYSMKIATFNLQTLSKLWSGFWWIFFRGLLRRALSQSPAALLYLIVMNTVVDTSRYFGFRLLR